MFNLRQRSNSREQNPRHLTLSKSIPPTPPSSSKDTAHSLLLLLLHLHDRPLPAISIPAFFVFSALLCCLHPRVQNPSTPSILIHRHPTGSHSHHTLAMARPQQDQFIDEDEEEEVCPLCVEEFDLGDKNFRPCPCGYQVSPLPSLTPSGIH
jgi:hypothetical protein